MRFRTLGTTDLEVSEVGFGVWTVATNWWGKITEEAGIGLLQKAYDLEINLFDTADSYGDGYGEEIVGVVARTNATEPMPPHVPTLEERHCADFLSLWAKSHEKKTDIAASLAMPRDLALRIARDGTRALTGWRAEALGEDVAAVMDGKKGLFMDLEGVKVR